MTEIDVFVLADRTLNGVVAKIADDQWAMVMPPEFKRAGAEVAPTLREVIEAHAYDDAWVPDMLAGHTMADVGPEAFKGDLLGHHPYAAFAAIVETACAAALSLHDLDRTVHCSFGDFPAREYLWQVTMFRGFRAYDIAKVIGVDSELPPLLVQGLWDEITPIADDWRRYGVFPAEVVVPADAPLFDRLLGLAGRSPEHHG
jgi:hypothetical protein